VGGSISEIRILIMKVTINNETRQVIPLSQLTFREFNRIIVKHEVTDIIGYLSLFFDLTKEKMMDARVSQISLTALHASLFDVDIVAAIKTKLLTVECLGQFYSTDSLAIDTFGKSYFFELKKQGEATNYELAMYALALALSLKNEDVDVIYDDLCAQTWTKVLPQAFFLLRRSRKQKLTSRLSLIGFTWGLRKIAFKIRYFQAKYRKLEKRSSQKIYVSDLV
jgi:hypothetical protein